MPQKLALAKETCLIKKPRQINIVSDNMILPLITRKPLITLSNAHM